MHPVLFEIFGEPIHTYATMIAIAFVVAIWLTARYGEKQGYDREMLLDLSWWLLVSGLVGSRLAFMMVNWDQYYYPCVDLEHFNSLYPAEAIEERDCTRILRFWNGGLVFYGGPILAIITMVWFLRREQLPILPIADVIIPTLALGQFFGRLGCLGAGCCWGKVTELPWGIEFPKYTMVFKQQFDLGLIEPHASHALGVHPTQLYDSLGGLLLFFVLIYIRHHKRFHGQVFIAWLMLYPLMRSLIEVFRGDDNERGFVFEVVYEPLNTFLGLPAASATFLSTSQFISVGFLLIGAVLLKKKWPKPAAQ